MILAGFYLLFFLDQLVLKLFWTLFSRLGWSWLVFSWFHFFTESTVFKGVLVTLQHVRLVLACFN